MAGYSGTPLAKKLGIRDGDRLVVVNAPTGYRALLDPLPDAVLFDQAVSVYTDIVHAFCMNRRDMETQLTLWRHQIRSDAFVWISWPKK